MKGWVLRLKYDLGDLVICRGTLMMKDTPIGELYVDEGDVASIDVTCGDKSIWPLEMQYLGVGGILDFLKARVTPRSRKGLSVSLCRAGFTRYSIAAILLASNGRDCSDPYWIRFKDGPQTWKEVWEAVGVYNKS